MRARLVLALGAFAIGLSCASSVNFATLWRAGKIDEAVKLQAKQLEFQQGRNSALFGRIVREDGQPLTQSDRDDISVLPSILAFNDYWSPEGYFLVHLPAGNYLIQPRGSHWVADTSPVRLEPHTVLNVGTITLRPRDLSSMPRTRVRLNVRRASGTAAVLGAGGIRVLADKLDKTPFEAVTGEDGTAEIEIPRIPGRWRVSSKEPGYAEVWDFFDVTSGTEIVELGRFEITPLKQVTIRWMMPKQPGSHRFNVGQTVGGTTVLKSYDTHDSPDGTISREFSFATGGLIDVRWKERSDLELIQSGAGEILVETEPGLRSTTLLEFFPGTFATILEESDLAAMCDLGDIALESVERIPLDQLRSLTERGEGLPVIKGHTYALRSFDGKRHVLLHVEKIEDQAIDPRK